MMDSTLIWTFFQFAKNEEYFDLVRMVLKIHLESISTVNPNTVLDPYGTRSLATNHFENEDEFKTKN